ncbi:A/G-specific adenine glycosylase [Sulfitobacter sp. M57]|uniref:A/G-specific adenine glycosylase n=1 Tax=unclassified Sulfitobacter TaxID=196795 RepID=UPI0023E1AD0E|nr:MULTISPECIES: A/G-specific adenine glycosylase [unclassified Sulfitobacter]MDF3415317.1 A/G-specific adenine glycosylase [Sulfitobacter sp. KE5]MDF3422798.1 A/G-specific adenine glycosylase [Sulfitobacter sp. KE43]MDF3433863.1 A/G-specific adenine glycosylase [Sulfitobacter sp. KE42]MDF3459503.1 A/G-specific adenine glycosylase [Sulfitobacter sp. S74]MDF3463402.1 A/G-specific adenine glycosylase [Sulfitobacter sp. Ks18]
MPDTIALPRILLDWYDIHAREMPWRVGPAQRKAGVQPDPYRIWMSEIMLQQTTVATVRDYFQRFVTRWPTVGDLAAAQDADVMAEWAGLGYYARARNLLKCARAVVDEHAGEFPADHAALLKLPGIGPYTAAAVSSIAFDLRHTVLDGNVERVMARLYDVHTPLPAVKPVLMERAEALTPAKRPGDYAQAVMDLGATICSPKSPACGICPWRDPCAARAMGTQNELPKKTPKKPKPVRHGTVYLAQRTDGAWLLETRPEKGLLGGMLGWPGSDWVDTSAPLPKGTPPVAADWQALAGEVRHTFTHFHLILTVQLAKVPNDTPGDFVPRTRFRPSDLPTVMRKAYDLAQG